MIIESIKITNRDGKSFRHSIPASQWEEMKRNGDSRKYRVVSWEEEPNEIDVPEVKPAPQIERVIKKNTKRKPRAKK